MTPMYWNSRLGDVSSVIFFSFTSTKIILSCYIKLSYICTLSSQGKVFKWHKCGSISEVYKFFLNFTKLYKLRNGVQNMVMKTGILCCTEVAWLARNMQPNYTKRGLCSQNNFSKRNMRESEKNSIYSITLLFSKMAVPTCQSTWWLIPLNHNLTMKMHSLPLSRNCLSILLEKMRISTKKKSIKKVSIQSKSIWIDAVNLTILNSPLWRTNPNQNRPLLLGYTYSSSSSTALSISHTLFWIASTSSNHLPFKVFLIQGKREKLWGHVWGVWGLTHLWNVLPG